MADGANPDPAGGPGDLPDPGAPEPDKVGRLFDRLAGRYDWFNRCASLGLDRTWRAALVRSLRQMVPGPRVLLDLGTGTGDLIHDAVRSAAEPPGRFFEGCSFIGMDLSRSMVRQARAKLNGPIRRGVHLLQGNAASVPLAGGTVDAVVSAFVLRNVRKVMAAVLAETLRVLRPEGRIFFLEMYLPEGGPLRGLHRIYLRTVLPLVGKAVFGPDWSGGYLAETIQGFGSPEDFSQTLRRAGFREVRFHRLSGGIAVLHSGRK